MAGFRKIEWSVRRLVLHDLLFGRGETLPHLVAQSVFRHLDPGVLHVAQNLAHQVRIKVTVIDLVTGKRCPAEPYGDRPVNALYRGDRFAGYAADAA
jgi:hypothetical protein